MEPLKPPRTIKYYQLLKMSTKNSFTIYSCGTVPPSANYIGTGIYMTLQEAEHNRTLETLKDTDGGYNSYHIFELEFPNPVYKE
jgi:hypothetical protein